MKQLVEYELEDGQPILIEVDLPEAGIAPASRDQIIKTKQRFEDALAHIKPVARAVLSKLEGLNADEIGVEFGVKFSGKVGIVVASADSEANIIVHLTWKNENHRSHK